MFRKVKRSIVQHEAASTSPGIRNTDPEASIVGNGVTIKGDIQGAGEVVLQGRLEGKLEVKGRVSVGPDGVTVGRVAAEEVVLKGSVEGEVEARRRLVITSSGILSGAMNAPRLVIEEGGRLQGRCRMHPAAREGAAEPEEGRPLLPSFQEALES